MGHGIAQALAATGRTVALYEPDLGRADRRPRPDRREPRARPWRRAGSSAAERDAILGRIEPTADLAAAADVDLVVEAVFEDLAVKSGAVGARSTGARRRRRSSPRTPRRSRSTSSPRRSDEGRRARFVGMHFFSPVPVMPLIELIRGSATSDATEAAVRAPGGRDGQAGDRRRPDRPGFIVNRILMPFLGEAMRAYEEGLGTADDIDTGAKVGLNHPMGPLELADFIGLDVCLGIMRVLHEGLGEEQFAPPAVLVELVEAGHLGQKTGRGFHVLSAALRLGRRPTRSTALERRSALVAEEPAEQRPTVAMSNGFARSWTPVGRREVVQLGVEDVAAHEREAPAEDRVDRR